MQIRFRVVRIDVESTLMSLVGEITSADCNLWNEEDASKEERTPL